MDRQQDSKQQQEAKEQKEKLKDLVARAKKDPSFKQQVQNDPVGVLRREGLSDGAINDVLRDEGYKGRGAGQGAGDDVGTMRGCWFTCMTTSGCSITISTA